MADEFYFDLSSDPNYSYDYVPGDTSQYLDVGYDPTAFNSLDLASLLADQGIIPYDQFDMPDFSALYSSPDLLGAAADGLPITEMAPMTQPQTLGTLSANGDSIQQVGDGMFMVNGQLMDSVQMSDYMNRPISDSTNDMNFLRSVANMSEPGLHSFNTFALQGIGDGYFGKKHDALTVRTDPNGRIIDTGDADAPSYMDSARGLTLDGAPVGAEGYKPGYLSELLASNLDPEVWAANEGRDFRDWLSASGEVARDSTGDWNSINAAARGMLNGNGRFSGLPSLSLQRAIQTAANSGASRSLSKGQTASNTASTLAMLAAALAGNKGMKPADGNKDRGTNAWQISRAAGSGRVNKATGGRVLGALSQATMPRRVVDESGAGGQADIVQANLSGGEYVMDADVVSALGDGDTNAGAKRLDQMREEVRAHKRSAPAHKIPPKAKSPLAYMKKGAK